MPTYAPLYERIYEQSARKSNFQLVILGQVPFSVRKSRVLKRSLARDDSVLLSVKKFQLGEVASSKPKT